MNGFQLEKKKWLDLLEAVNQLEVKGQLNIFIMYKIIAFIQTELSEIEKRSQEE